MSELDSVRASDSGRDLAAARLQAAFGHDAPAAHAPAYGYKSAVEVAGRPQEHWDRAAPVR
jgi:hypothetical protein